LVRNNNTYKRSFELTLKQTNQNLKIDGVELTECDRMPITDEMAGFSVGNNDNATSGVYTVSKPIKLRKGDEVRNTQTGEIATVVTVFEHPPTSITYLSNGDKTANVSYKSVQGRRVFKHNLSDNYYTLHKQYQRPTKPKAQHRAVTGQPMFGDEGKVGE